mmetsp:Transcript_128207/g.356780  ORF Transcript_128207/g.356780 Transcript_128207/m.356780 type:complete len:295 (+) Transcript_128207:1054-1938(+)
MMVSSFSNTCGGTVWTVMMTEEPVCLSASLMLSKSWIVVWLSRPLKGSSKMLSTAGLTISNATATRFFWPPLRFAILLRRTRARPNRGAWPRAMSHTARRPSAGDRMAMPKARACSTVRFSDTGSYCEQYLTASLKTLPGIEAARLPRSSSVPRACAPPRRPRFARTSRKVVLPAPERPMSPSSSPRLSCPFRPEMMLWPVLETTSRSCQKTAGGAPSSSGPSSKYRWTSPGSAGWKDEMEPMLPRLASGTPSSCCSTICRTRSTAPSMPRALVAPSSQLRQPTTATRQMMAKG